MPALGPCLLQRILACPFSLSLLLIAAPSILASSAVSGTAVNLEAPAVSATDCNRLQVSSEGLERRRLGEPGGAEA
jgi:hypothetical protein